MKAALKNRDFGLKTKQDSDRVNAVLTMSSESDKDRGNSKKAQLSIENRRSS